MFGAIYVLAMAGDDNATPTALLRREHELILEIAGAVSRMLADGDNEPLDYDALGSCITFFRLYADACHHGKEEDLLFPALAANGLPEQGGPVAVMLEEHEQGRTLVRAMVASLAGAQAGEASADVNLRNAAAGFVELITAHIAKEDNILFEMADNLLAGQACEDLCAAYGKLSEERFEGHSKQDLVSIAGKILDRS